MKKSIKSMSINEIIQKTTKKAIDQNRVICKENLKIPKGKELI